MSLASPVNNDVQNQNESFNRSSNSSPINSDNLETNANGTENSDCQSDVVNQTKMFKCKQCAFICVNKEDYWLHQRQMHIKPEKLLECSKCPFVTEYKHHLEYHLRNHIGSKPYKCSQCEYACVNLSMLRSHLKSHSKAIQYNCAECSYSTKYYNSLKAHMEKFNHTGTASANAASLVNNVKNGKIKNQIISQNTSSSSSSSTCSSSSFNSSSFDLINQKRQRKQNKHAMKQSRQGIFDKDRSVNSSNSSVSSASSSLSSSPNWSNQLNINQQNISTNLKQQYSENTSQMNFNPTTALAAAALACQQQQSAPNILFNPSLLFNTHNLGSLFVQNSSEGCDAINISDENKLKFDSNTENNNQFNLMQQQIQLQMALAMAASNNQFQNNNQNNQQISNILSDLYLQQQQKSQQEQLLLAASYLQNGQLNQIPSNKRSLELESNENDIVQQQMDSKKTSLNNSNDHVHKPFKCVNCPIKFDSKKELKKHIQTNHQFDTELVTTISTKNEPTKITVEESQNNQLHECFKCELIFRNYEMYLAHEMLHNMQDQQKDDNNNKLIYDELMPQQNSRSMDLNNLLTQRLMAESLFQNYNNNEKTESKFDCNQCNLKISNALQYFIHVQTFHNTKDAKPDGSQGSITNIQIQSIDQIK